MATVVRRQRNPAAEALRTSMQALQEGLMGYALQEQRGEQRMERLETELKAEKEEAEAARAFKRSQAKEERALQREELEAQRELNRYRQELNALGDIENALRNMDPDDFKEFKKAWKASDWGERLPLKGLTKSKSPQEALRSVYLEESKRIMQSMIRFYKDRERARKEGNEDRVAKIDQSLDRLQEQQERLTSVLAGEPTVGQVEERAAAEARGRIRGQIIGGVEARLELQKNYPDLAGTAEKQDMDVAVIREGANTRFVVTDSQGGYVDSFSLSRKAIRSMLASRYEEENPPGWEGMSQKQREAFLTRRTEMIYEPPNRLPQIGGELGGPRFSRRTGKFKGANLGAYIPQRQAGQRQQRRKVSDRVLEELGGNE